MVLRTIVTTSNPHTIYFDHALVKPSYIRLLSTSIYNSWHSLKNKGDISLFNPENKKQLTGAFPLDIIILVK